MTPEQDPFAAYRPQQSTQPEDEFAAYRPKYEKSAAVTPKETTLSGLATQAYMGGMKGGIYRNPYSAVAATALDFLTGAVGKDVASQLLESDVEMQESLKGTPDLPPPLTRKGLESGIEQFEEKALGGEGVTGGIISAPLRAFGIETKPQTKAEQALRDMSFFLALTKNPDMSVEAWGRSARGAATYEGVKLGLEQLGMPSWLTEFIAFPAGLGGTTPLPTRPIRPSPGREQVAETAERFNLPRPKGLVNPPERTAGIYRPAATEQQIQRHREETQAAVRGAGEQIVQEALPIAGLEEEGHDLAEIRTRLFNNVREEAQSIPGTLDTEPIIDYIENTITQLERIPSPNDATRALIQNLRRKQRDFHTRRFMSAADAELQYREINQEINNLYDRNNLTAADWRTRETIRGVNRQFEEQFSNQLAERSPEFASQFRVANQFNTQYENLIATRRILDPVFENGEITSRSINRALRNPNNRRRLNRAIGEEGVQHLEHISEYLQQVDNLYNMFDVQRGDIGSLMRLLITKGIKYQTLAALFGHKAAGIITGVDTAGSYIIKNLRGRILLNRNTEIDFENVLRAINENSQQEFLRWAQRLDQDVANL